MESIVNCCSICKTDDAKVQSETIRGNEAASAQLSSVFSITQCVTHKSLHSVIPSHPSHTSPWQYITAG